MSEENKQRMPAPRQRMGPGGGHGPGGFGRPVEKAKDFKGTLRRLIGYLKPYKINLLIVLMFAVASTVFAIASPKVQANAINKLTDGYMARTMLKEMAAGQHKAVDQIYKQLGDAQDKMVKQIKQQMAQAQAQMKANAGKASEGGQKTAGGSAAGKSSPGAAMNPEATKTLQEMLQLPSLNALTDKKEKNDTALKLMDCFVKLQEMGVGTGQTGGTAEGGTGAESSGQTAMKLTPETIDSLRGLLELPMLDSVDDPVQKADIAQKMLAMSKSMTGLQNNAQQSMQPQKFTQAQVDDAIRAIRETGGKIDFDYILRIILILIGMFILSASFQFIMQWVMSSVAQRTSYQLRKDVDNKLSKLPLKYYDSKTHGEILSRVTNDVDSISTTLQQSITQVITSIIQIIGYIIMMLVTSPLLTVIVLATMPLYVLTTAFIAKKSQKYFASQQKELGELSGHVEEMYTGHKVVKAFGHEDKSIEKFESVNNRLYEAGWKAQFVSGIMFPLMNFISNIGYVLICVVGGIWMTKERIKLGDITAFIQYSRSFTMPIVQTANIANIIQSTIACAERVFEVLDEQEEIPDAETALVIKKPEGQVAFENVDFSYKENEPLIKDMNLSLNRGDTIAIVGPTGAGKTTLVNLLMRFYEINGGSIKIDGIDIRNIKRGALRSMFGMVLQDTWLFNGTIRDNIAYGRKDASMDDIVRAARAAHADHFIRTLPDGYDTVLNEEATNISQGQKQLLTIARAILADPAMLILDEATSSVDTRTEVLIQKAMANLMKGRTSFVIAHRLSTIRDAELILVMNHGTIIEQGNHKELLDKGGFYADLYNSQFTGANLEAEAV